MKQHSKQGMNIAQKNTISITENKGSTDNLCNLENILRLHIG